MARFRSEAGKAACRAACEKLPGSAPGSCRAQTVPGALADTPVTRAGPADGAPLTLSPAASVGAAAFLPRLQELAL